MREAEYTTRVELANRPQINLFRNPTAQLTLTHASATNCTLIRQTAGGFGSPYDTAFRLNAGASADSFLGVGHDTLTPGVQYTVSATIRIDGAISGTIDGRSRRIVVLHRIGTGAYTQLQSAQAPNSAGQTRLSITFTLPVGTTEVIIRFYHGATAGVVWWHSLMLREGTGTDYFDGSNAGALVSREWGVAEVGWDGVKGESTSWRVLPDGPTLTDATVDRIVYDRRSVPWVDATISLPYPGDAVWAQLDPRQARDVILYFAVYHRERDPGTKAFTVAVSHLPLSGGVNPDARGKLWLREATHDEVTDRVTLRAASGEVRMEDKKRLSAAALDTGATTPAALWRYALVDVGEAAAEGIVDGSATTTTIPAGDRRFWMQGESASRLFEDELAACSETLRNYCGDTGVFSAEQFDLPPVGTGILTDFPMSTGDNGTIITAERTLSRTNGWADATLVKANYVDSAGVSQTAYQRDMNGVNRAGKVVNISRAIPSANIASAYTAEAGRMGSSYRFTAMADFRCKVGRRSIVITRTSTGEVVRVVPDRVTYRPTDGEMEVEGYVL